MPNALDLFGKKLRLMREARALSQEKLAELCGVHRNYIGRVERAETNMKFERVIRLSVGLKVRPELLFRLIPKHTLEDAIELEKAVKRLNRRKD